MPSEKKDKVNSPWKDILLQIAKSMFSLKKHPVTRRQCRPMKNAWTQFCDTCSSWRGRGLACMPGSIPAKTDQSNEALTNWNASLTTPDNSYDCVNTICVCKSCNGLSANNEIILLLRHLIPYFQSRKIHSRLKIIGKIMENSFYM